MAVNEFKPMPVPMHSALTQNSRTKEPEHSLILLLWNWNWGCSNIFGTQDGLCFRPLSHHSSISDVECSGLYRYYL